MNDEQKNKSVQEILDENLSKKFDEFLSGVKAEVSGHIESLTDNIQKLKSEACDQEETIAELQDALVEAKDEEGDNWSEKENIRMLSRLVKLDTQKVRRIVEFFVGPEHTPYTDQKIEQIFSKK